MTSPPERILMTADAMGGVWTYALALSRCLADEGSEILLAVLGPVPDEAQKAEAAQIPGLTLVELPGRLEWMEQPEVDLELHGRALMRLARDFHPAVVHVNGYAQAALHFPCPSVAVAHSCVWSWWRAVEGGDPPAIWDAYRRRVRSGLAGADLVIAPTAAFLDEIRGLYRTPFQGMVVHNGLADLHDSRTAKQPLVLAAGRLWDNAKNLGSLCAVADRLPWPVYLAGPLAQTGEPVPEIGRARSLGRLTAPQMRDWMDRAAIFAAPARYEPFGLAVLEAAQTGAALVLGDLPSQREIWGDCALFVPPKDSEALHDAIALLIRDAETRHALGARARERARRYTANAMAAGTKAAYRQAAETHATRLAS